MTIEQPGVLRQAARLRPSLASPAPLQRAVGLWLLSSAGCVLLMLIVGGATRLTGSGLSMVEWQPILGAIPPLSAQTWQEAFAKYQQFPEYQKVNVGMDLAGFKAIFWLEYLHRLLGRSVGLVFLLPFLYFLRRRALGLRLVRLLTLTFFLGGFQGLVGWYMVKSGLVERPQVSQYRLAAHLLTALVIYALLLWLALDHLRKEPRSIASAAVGGVRRLAVVTLGLLFATMGAGALVAGLKAGLAYSTFPLMGGKLVPDGLWAYAPGWRNLFENVAAVQFQHRLLATLVALLVVLLSIRARRVALPPNMQYGIWAGLGLVLVQYSLGVLTVLLYVPKLLAGFHQVTGTLLFSALLLAVHRHSPQAEATRGEACKSPES